MLARVRVGERRELGSARVRALTLEVSRRRRHSNCSVAACTSFSKDACPMFRTAGEGPREFHPRVSRLVPLMWCVSVHARPSVQLRAPCTISRSLLSISSLKFRPL